MAAVESLVQVLCVTISILGAAIATWGVAEAIINFVKLKVSAQQKNQIIENEAIRQRLGAHLLLGLEVFIAADIISSVLSPTWNKVGILAAIVAIRTVLSYFLRMEVRQTQR